MASNNKMSNFNRGKNRWAAKNNPGKNPIARGTMNTGGNSFAIPWETNHLVFRSFEEGSPVVEALCKKVEAVLAECADAPDEGDAI